VSAQFKRFAKGGREVYIQATYNPILGADGKPIKVVKFATDVTERVLKDADFSGQVDAISRAQGVIEFSLDGTILTANDKFLKLMGYELSEIQGRKHSLFVDETFAKAKNMPTFGNVCAAATISPANSIGSPRAAATSLSKRPTTQSTTSMARRSRS
jgi:methyl-accepting chemotaxis protein